MNDRQILEKASRDMILDSFVDSGLSLDSVPTDQLARLYDEVMATDTSPPQVKTAAEEIDPDTRAAMEKAAEDNFLGRMAAQAYAVTYLGGVEKIAQGISGLLAKIRGRTPEEREQEISLVPREVENVTESTEAQRGGENLRQLQIRELTQRQQMANQLRKLQLQDQHNRRIREEEMFRRLHPGGGFETTKATLGGGIAGLAGGKLLQGLAASGAQGAERLLPVARRLGTVGALGGLSLGLLGGSKPTRVTERLERERYVPSSLSGDVRMASAKE
jgi:hypothetical protein